MTMHINMERENNFVTALFNSYPHYLSFATADDAQTFIDFFFAFLENHLSKTQERKYYSLHLDPHTKTIKADLDFNLGGPERHIPISFFSETEAIGFYELLVATLEELRETS